MSGASNSRSFQTRSDGAAPGMGHPDSAGAGTGYWYLNPSKSLPFKTAATIAWRELRASKAKFSFVILSVAIGVAALIGVRGFSESFQKTILAEARTIMAADLSARMFRQPTPQEAKQLDALQQTTGVRRTWITETVSMVSAMNDPVPLLVTLKAVNPDQWPFYGSVQMQTASGGQTTDLKSELNDSTVVVGDDLLVRLKVKIGDELKIGEQRFRIAAMLKREPDRMTSTMGLGPRVLISRGGLEKSGLLQPGSRSGERFLFKLTSQNNIAKVRAQLEKILPEAQVIDFRETSPALTEGLDRATGMLSLICLVAMVLGAVGVAMAMRAHLQQRIDILAIMKSIGARSSDILRIYLLQTLFLGLTGGLLGVALGAGVEWIFPAVLGKLLPIHAHLQLPIRSVFAGLGTGILTTLLFCLPPLLDVRKVRPNLVLRRAVEDGNGGDQLTFWQKIRENKVQWVASVLIVLGLGGIAAALTDSMQVGAWFGAALCALLLFTLGVSALTLRGLRSFLNKTRLHLPSAVRHALANLYRPGNQSSAVLAALGTGVMLILVVFLMQSSVLSEMKEGAKPDTPNIFLIDMATSELPGVRDLLDKQPGIRGKMEALPVVSGRIDSIDGVPVEKLKVNNYPKRLLQSVSLTWSDELPAGAKMVSGHWWAAGEMNSVAIVDHVADRLHLHVGSEINFDSDDQLIKTTVAAIYKNDGQHVYGRSEFILPRKALEGMPVIWYGAAHVDGPQIAAMQRALFAAYPTVTVINIADVLDTIQGFIGQITQVVRFLAGFSMLSGVVILASSVASTRYRRIREVVVLKTIGATRGRIATVFSVEFIVLGLLSGVVGVIFANLLTKALLHRLDVPFHLDWLAGLAALVSSAVLATATGWVASARILGQKPLQVLREE
jgi:putative ABC transport system permease protein